MSGDRQQDARLVEQLVSRLTVAYRADLQRDQAIVAVVERLDDASLAARSQRLQDLIALPDQRRHWPVAPFPAL